MIWRTSENGYVPWDDPDAPVEWPLPARPGPKGIHLSTSLDRLICEVVLAPTAPDWVQPLLLSLIAKYGYAFPVRKSKLNRLSYV